MAPHRALKILFTTWEGGGNIPPVATAVRRLIARGHAVRVMSDAASRRAIEASGAAFVAWREAPNRPDLTIASDLIRDWQGDGPMDGITKMRDVIMAGGALGYARDTAAELARDNAELIVSSEMTLGAMVAAEARRVPLALLMANVSMLPIADVPPMGPGLAPARDAAERALHAQIAQGSRAMFNQGLPALNAARRAFGLAPLADLLAQTDWARRILIGTSASFDFPTSALPARFAYVGPLLGEPDWAGDDWQSPWPSDDPRPLVLVSFSTTFQDQSGLIARTVAALGQLPVRGLVTVGPTIDPASFVALPGNVVVHSSAPHDRVMPQADVVVTHGGHGTVLRALSHGRPLLCMPMGRDQNDNAARVAFHGAGLTLPPTAGAHDIATASRRLCDEPSFRDNAARLRAAIARDVVTSPLVPVLEGLVRDKATPRISVRTASSGIASAAFGAR